MLGNANQQPTIERRVPPPPPPPFQRVSFAGGSATIVRDPRVLSLLRSLIARSMRSVDTTRVALPLPISPELKHVQMIKAGHYLVSEKVDGVRYALVMCMLQVGGEWRRICALVGRNSEAYIVPFVVTESLFVGGSVYDGELVKDFAGRWRFVMFDAYMVSGDVISTKPFQHRILRCWSLFRDCYTPMPADLIEIACKRFFPLRTADPVELRAIMDNCEETRAREYPTDGLILVHANSVATHGTNKTMLKFKSVHTIDLQVCDAEYTGTGTGYTLCSALDDKLVSVLALGGDLPDGLSVGSIVECALTRNADCAGEIAVTPGHIRNDKTTPNSQWVVTRTIQTVRDAVSIEDCM